MALASLKASSKGVTILIILAAVIFFGCVLAYMGAAGKLRAVATELKSKEQQVADAERVAKTLEESRLRYLDTRAQIRYLESSVSTQAYVPTLLKQLEQLGRSVKLKVVSVRPRPVAVAAPTRRLNSGAEAAKGNVEAASQQKAGSDGAQTAAAVDKPYDELPIDLELEGSYVSTMEFLYGLISFPKIIAVNRVELSPAGATAAFKSPMLSIRLSVTAFVLKEDGPVAEPDAPVPSAKASPAAGEGRS